MPQTDSLVYLHGTGGTMGPITSTANVAGSGSQTGTILTVTTLTTGQISVGAIVSGTGVPVNEYVVANGSGSGTAGTYTVSASSTVAPATALTFSPATMGDTLGGSGYSKLELDFGAPNTGAAWPYLPQFPSLTEKGYSFPPEVVGQGGTDFGVHILIESAFNNLTSYNFEVCTSSATAALYTASPNPIASRTLTLAQMQVVGAHYYIPVSGAAVLEFLRWYAALTGTADTAGTLVSWFGPRVGGEQ